MEEAVIRHYPAILEDDEYQRRRPIGMAMENAVGYELIFQTAGFREVEVFKEAMTFVSTDEEEWWRQMLYIGWDSFLEKAENNGADEVKRIKAAILNDLQPYKKADGIHFDKVVFYVRGVK